MKTTETFPGQQEVFDVSTNGNHLNTLSREERNALIESAMHLIPGMSRKFMNSGLEFEELNQIGYLALAEAATRYDGSLGISFLDYSFLRVRGSMLDTLREGDVLSRRERTSVRGWMQAEDRLAQVHQKSPAAGEIAEELGISSDDAEKVRLADAISVLIPLDAPYMPPSEVIHDMNLIDIIQDPVAGEEDMVSSITAEDTMTRIKAYMLLEGNQKREVFRGIIKDRPQRDTARILGVTESRVSQVKAELLRDLSAFMLSNELSD